MESTQTIQKTAAARGDEPLSASLIGDLAKQPSQHLEAYKLLCDQLKHDESLFWTRFQLYLFVNSGLAALLIGMLGLLSRQQTSGQQPAFPVAAAYVSAVLVCAIGISITAVWGLLGARAQAICDHWVEHLKHLEKVKLAPLDFALFTKVDEFLEGKKTMFGDQECCFRGMGTLLRIYWGWRVLAICFLVLWLTLAGTFVWAWFNAGI